MKAYYGIELKDEEVKIIKENALKKVGSQTFSLRLGWFDRFCLEALPPDWMGDRLPLCHALFSCGGSDRVPRRSRDGGIIRNCLPS